MSRAFVRESDDRPELPIARPPAPLPAGAKNYITAQGAQRLREELSRLIEIERPRLAAAAADPDTKRQLLALDQKIEQLEQSLQSAEVVPPLEGGADAVRFGATVTVREGSGEDSTYRIVGVDETDYDRGWVSWLSPIAKALMNAKRGQRVQFKFPAGEETLEITDIRYE
jgi:transcription elongation factor GreB